MPVVFAPVAGRGVSRAREYLHDDLSYIRAQPGTYARDVALSVAATRGKSPGPGRMAYLKMLVLALTLALGPVLVVRRRHDRVFAGTLTAARGAGEPARDVLAGLAEARGV